MRKIVIAVVSALFFVTACNAKPGSHNQSANAPDEVTAQGSAKSDVKVKTIHLTKSEFLEKVANYETNPNEWKYLGDKPAIVDFYADWCGPCKIIAPVLEELAHEYDGEIYIYKIDTDKEQELASVFGIRSIPSLLFIPMDDQPQMVTGALPKENFEKAIKEILLKE